MKSKWKKWKVRNKLRNYRRFRKALGNHKRWEAKVLFEAAGGDGDMKWEQYLRFWYDR